jgi:type III secretory pathway component EscT
MEGIPAFVVVASLVFARLAPICFVIPYFGGRTTSWTVRAAVTVGLGALVLVVVPDLLLSVRNLSPSEMGLRGYIPLCVKELLLGFALALLGYLPFAAAEGVGLLADRLRGGGPSTSLAQHGEQTSSPLGTLYGWVAMLVFVSIDGPQHLLRALMGTFVVLPITELPSHEVWTELRRLGTDLGAAMFEAFAALSAPAIVVTVVGDLLIGMVARFVPPITGQVLVSPIRALIGLLVALAALGAFAAGVTQRFTVVPSQWRRLMSTHGLPPRAH